MFSQEAALLKKRDIPFKVKGSFVNFKEVDSTSRIVKLVANTFNFFDHDFDALTSTCANRSITNNGAKSQAPDKIAHLLHHEMHRPVGKSMSESVEVIDSKSVLYCESMIPETSYGEDTIINYDAGIYNQHSVGFKYLDLKFLEKGDIGWDKWLTTLINPEDADAVGFGWKVEEIKLWEYSTVTFGANKLTPYLGTKSGNKKDIADIICQKLNILATRASRVDVINKDAFNFEVSQLQQMIYELSEMTSLKSTTPEGSVGENTPIKKLELVGFSKKVKI